MSDEIQDGIPLITIDQAIALDDVFSYHGASQADLERFAMLEGAAKTLGRAIYRCCPPSADRTAALRKLRECMHVAKAAISLKGKSLL